MITFTRKGLIANTFLDDDAIDQILKNQDDAEKWSAFWSGFKTPNDKIVEQLEYQKKHPQAFNYAQFEVWVTDILNGGDGFPLPKFEGDKD